MFVSMNLDMDPILVVAFESINETTCDFSKV